MGVPQHMSLRGAPRHATVLSGAHHCLQWRTISTGTTEMRRQYYVYMMTNPRNTVIYTGVTNNLKKRLFEHREKLINGFTRRYRISKLVYYEVFEDAENAILREKQVKGGSRRKKVLLIDSMNPEWRDLYEEL